MRNAFNICKSIFLTIHIIRRLYNRFTYIAICHSFIHRLKIRCRFLFKGTRKITLTLFLSRRSNINNTLIASILYQHITNTTSNGCLAGTSPSIYHDTNGIFIPDCICIFILIIVKYHIIEQSINKLRGIRVIFIHRIFCHGILPPFLMSMHILTYIMHTS